MILHILLLFSTYAVLCFGSSCKPSDCNHAGECIGSNPTCKCFSNKYFIGNKCQQMVDNCQPNPCKGGVCKTLMGGYSCTADFNVVKEWYIHSNLYGNYGEEQKMILAFQELNDWNRAVEITTDNYFIDGFEANPSNNDKYFEYSSDLKSIAEGLGLHHTDKFPFNTGYYHITQANFWRIGKRDVDIIISVNDAEYFFDRTLEFYVLQPEEIICIPDVTFPHCMDPYDPIFLDIKRFNIFEPEIQETCGKDAAYTFRWWTFDSTETIFLHFFGRTNETRLRVPPYSLWFGSHFEITMGYVVRFEFRSSMEDSCVARVARCYFKVYPEPISGKIAGGEEREVGVGQTFRLDGSKSRDFALAPDAEQKMIFRWDCSSDDDPTNSYCGDNIGTSNVLTVEAGSLRLGMNYTYVLNLRSIVNEQIVSQVSQTITVVSANQHDVSIDCIRNCQNNQYASGKPIHLKAICNSCDHARNCDYEWMEGTTNVSNVRRVVHNATETTPTNLKVKINCEGLVGKASENLTLNTPPSGGNCKISPASGVEYTTSFQIECIDYVDEHMPILYQFIADDFTVVRTYFHTVNVSLPKLEKFKVVICDSLQACIDVDVSVAVTDMPELVGVQPVRDLFQEPENNLTNLFQSGFVSKGMVLLNALMRKAKPHEQAEFIYQSFNEFYLRTLLDIEQLTTISKNYLLGLSPIENKGALLLSKLLHKISQGFDFVFDSNEVVELIDGPYTILTNNFAEMLSKLSEELEEFPPVQTIQPNLITANDPIAESYEDWGELDATALIRTNNWLKASQQLHKCLQQLGVASARMHHPTETPLVINKDELSVAILSIEEMNSQELAFLQNADYEVYFSQSLVEELQEYIETENILLQTMFSKRNPFWWYPDEHPLSSDVIYFSAYSIDPNKTQRINVTNPINLVFKNIKPNMEQLVPLSDVIPSDKQMIVYSFKMPINGLLVIKFKSSSVDLLTTLELNKIPSSYKLRTKRQIVDMNKNETVFVLINDSDDSGTGYLAVLPAESIDGSVTFEFTSEIVECVSWSFEEADPMWITTGCRPHITSNFEKGIYCRCQHLSIFGCKIYAIIAMPSVRDHTVFITMPINWFMVILFLLFLLLLLWLLFCTLSRTRQKKRNAVVYLEEEDFNKKFNLIVYISTGSALNAGTTANIVLSFPVGQCQRDFIIYQDPDNPYFNRSTTWAVQLPLSVSEINEPIKIGLQRDSNGRYPNWYCRSIKIKNLENGKTDNIEVRQWIKQNEMLYFSPNVTNEDRKSKRQTFKHNLEGIFNNWFHMQSILGPWKYDSSAADRFERTCIWICKIFIMVCIVLAYYGKTTIENYEEERETYHMINISIWTILLLIIFCYIADILIHLCFEYFLHKYDNKQNEKN